LQTNKHILIVEDEESLANTLALNFKLEGIPALLARTGPEAIKLLNLHGSQISLVLLDIMLPGISGYDLFTEFRKQLPDLPIIFLTAKGSSGDKISGLKLGADDYVVKPFDLEELLLRVKNVLKRNAPAEQKIFEFNNCSINFDTYEIRDLSGAACTLSRREIGLLKLLTSKINQVISRDEILENLWEVHENASSRTIDNYILGFRKLFEEDPKHPIHFISVRSVGYKFVLPGK
jgi:two-component system, OmpR family, alkaline phosphatase synthesis response regulator PhoP